MQNIKISHDTERTCEHDSDGIIYNSFHNGTGKKYVVVELTG